jgi:hypothetical protein
VPPAAPRRRGSLRCGGRQFRKELPGSGSSGRVQTEQFRGPRDRASAQPVCSLWGSPGQKTDETKMASYCIVGASVKDRTARAVFHD